MNNKIISTLIISSIITSSCGKKEVNSLEVSSNQNQKQKEEIVSPKKITAPIFNDWLKLVTNGEKNNLALASILSTYIRSNNKEDSLIFLDENLNELEAESIINRVKANFEQKELDLLFLNDSDENSKIFEKTLYFALKNEIKANFEKQLVLETTSYIQNKYLTEIRKTYENALENNIKDISPKIQKELVEVLPNEATNIEKEILNGNKENALSKLKIALNKLGAVKVIKEEAGLNDTDMIVSTLVSLVAYQIYQDVKDTRAIRNIKVIIEDVKSFQQKIKNAGNVLKEIKKIHNNSALEFENIKNASKELKTNSFDLISQIKNDLDKSPENNLNFSEKIKALNNSLFKKKSFQDQNKIGSYQTKADLIVANVTSINNSLSNMNSNFNNTLKAFETLSKAIGIKLGKDAQKIINGAKKVSSMVNMATGITSGFLSGGPIGAMTAFSGVLGGTSTDAALSEISSKLNEIDRKLDEVIALQKQMIELQLETMKMIRDLSLLVDELHQKEMIKLHELRNDVLVNIEMTKALANREIKSCETIIANQIKYSYALAGKTNLFDYSADANIVSMTHKEFYGEFRDFKKFSKILKSGPTSNFEKCHSAISNVFGMKTLSENPTVAVYNSGEENALLFLKNKYRPLVKQYQYLAREKEINQNLLHLPFFKLKDLPLIKFSHSNNMEFFFDMDQLISSNALVRYTNSLLILYPLLDFDSLTIKNGIEAMISDFFSDLELEPRSLAYLKNALYIINNAIAQEHLLSGSLLLDDISKNLSKYFSKNFECSSSIASNECAVLNNKIILQNLVNYLSLNAESYHAALEAKNINEMENALGRDTDLFKGKVFISEDKMYLKLSLKIKTAENTSEEIIRTFELKNYNELKESEIIYSENMEKLVKLQAKVIEAINLVSPHYLSRDLSQKYASLILLKAH